MNEKFVSQYTYVVVSNDGGNFYTMRSPNYIVYIKFDLSVVVTKAPHVKGWGLPCLSVWFVLIFLLPPFIIPHQLVSTQKLLVNKYYEAI